MKKFPLVMISLFGFSAAAFAAVTENLNSGVNASIPGQTRSAPQARVETQKSATVERFASTAKSVHVVDLGKASDAELQKMQKSAKANESSEKVGRLQIGFPRDIPENMRTVPLSLLPWQALADGSRALRFELAATGAAGMRVGYRFDGPADGAELRFASSAPEATVYKAMSSPGKDLLWSPTMDGERGTIEVLVRPGYNPSAFSLVLEQISQLTVKSSELNSKARSSTCQGTGIGCAESCNVDLACVSNPSQALQDIARATAKMTYVEGGRSFLCTGTLLNSVPFSGVPYFFTNAHCIDSQAAASTLETNWFFDSVSCNSLSTPPSQRLTTGAALLVTDVTMDVTLLRLNSAPPTGAVFAAWDATVVPKSATVVGVHHPSGDLKMFSQGQMQGYVPGPTNCGTSANPVTCDTYLRDSYQSIIWSNGTTEGGSSGSGVYTFNSNCGSGQSCYQLRGGLQGGAASCGNPSGRDRYSRMDLLFTRLAPFLAPSQQIPATGSGTAVMTEYYNPEFDYYFMTSRENEKSALNSARDAQQNLLWYPTGYWFKADQNSSPSTSSIVRYFNGQSVQQNRRGTHFYTATNEDKQTITNSGLERFSTQNCSDVPRFWCNEGIDSYVTPPLNFNASCPSGTIPVYRAFRRNTDDANHRFMPNLGLYQYMLGDGANVGDVWAAEGIAFCARP